MVHFTEIRQGPLPHSMFQHLRKVATPELVPRNCLRYLQTAMIIGGGVGRKIYGGILDLTRDRFL